MGLAHGTNNGCGITQYSNVPIVSDPYAYMASNIPTDLPTRCSNSYSQEFEAWLDVVGRDTVVRHEIIDRHRQPGREYADLR